MKSFPDYPGLFVVNHPLVQDKLTRLRDRKCPPYEFKALLQEIAVLMAYAVTENLPLTTTRIETPLVAMDAPVLAEPEPVIVPILRAGLGMAEALHLVLPRAVYGHIGLYRDEKTHLPVEYLIRLPKCRDRTFLLTDPMLATGNSAKYAIDVLVRNGVPVGKIMMLCLVAAPEGYKTLHAAYPGVPVYTAALDSHLNENAYILPGLGDAGDRIFGTV